MIKKLFIISLLNFVFVLGVVFVAKAVIVPKAAENLTESVIAPTIAAPTTSPTLTVSATKTITPAATIAPTAIPTVDPLAGHCLVYLDGARYDLTEFRNMHSGGNIFQCGTDMSDIFHGQHPVSFLAKISQYKI